MVLLFVLIGPAQSAPDSGIIKYKDGPVAFQFACPRGFVPGEFDKTYAKNVESATKPCLLVEKKLVAGRNLKALAPGCSAIIITAYKEPLNAKYNPFDKPENITKMGKLDVARLPSPAGPYSDNAFYYVARLDRSLVVSFLAPKRYWDGPSKGAATGYDKIIEATILTLNR
jgi:hypothetical protein